MDGNAGRSGKGSSARGVQRRADLLALVVEDVSTNGLVDFSLRRAARNAGATHKVLLYHFGSADELLREALTLIRSSRIDAASAAAKDRPAADLPGKVQAVWDVLISDAGPRVLDQASGLALYDSKRYARLGQEATEQYLPAVLALCPEEWDELRRDEVATLVLAVLRGLLLDALTGAHPDRVDAGLRAVARALEREQASSP